MTTAKLHVSLISYNSRTNFTDTVEYEWNLKDVLDFNKHAGNSPPIQNTSTLFYIS